jgi:hypothetical protein
MSLRIRNKSLMRSSRDTLPELGELVVGYQVFTPIFAAMLDVNGEPEWFEVTFKHGPKDTEIEYRLIDGDEPAVMDWAPIPSVIEV